MKTGESGKSFSPKTDTVCSGRIVARVCKVHALNNKWLTGETWARNMEKNLTKEIHRSEKEVYANAGWSGMYRWALEWEQNIC